MKKIFTTMAALALCSTAAFAQTIEISPETGDVEGFSFPVTITVEVEDATLVMIQTMGGAGFTQTLSEPAFLTIPEEGPVTFNLTKEMWGDSYNAEFDVQVIVIPMDDEMTPFFDEDDEYIMYGARYTYTPSEAVFVKSVPNNDWLKTTFAQAYADNEFKLFFSREVSPTGNIGYIEYLNEDGESLDDPFAISNYTVEWSDLDGMCIVSFPYANSDFSAEELGCIKFTFNNFHYSYKDGDKTISGDTEVDEIVLSNGVIPAPQQRIQRNKKGLEAGLTTIVEPANVYSLQGSIVKKNANDLSGLQPGLYIVDGKKVVVK